MSILFKRFAIGAIALLIVSTILAASVISSQAAPYGGSTVSVTANGQSVDSIEYNGITVDALYRTSASHSDPVYSCAALISRFYRTVYGIEVNNLYSSSSTPTASSGGFTATREPKKGDIVRYNYKTHWALVKEVKNGVVTLIEQNWSWSSGSGRLAAINRQVSVNDSDVTFFRYSLYEPDMGPPATIKGVLESFDSGVPATIELMQDGKTVYSTQTKPVLQDTPGTATQEFKITDIKTGKYDLVVSKEGHNTYTLMGIMLVSGTDLDLTKIANEAISKIALTHYATAQQAAEDETVLAKSNVLADEPLDDSDNQSAANIIIYFYGKEGRDTPALSSFS